jgi:NAD(P)H-dependent flavin oxidoreductase YrpB (nitropropane dioxygenase family)
MLNNIAALVGAPSAAVGDYQSIQTVSATGSSAAISFTSIPSTYTHLQIRGIAAGVNNTFADITFNSDTGTNYAQHDIYGDGASAGAEASATRANIPATALPNTANIFNGLVVDILDYANTNKYKTARILQGRDTNGGGVIYFMSGLWQNTNAISTITITSRSGNIANYSSFALYGIK